ncbi:tetratricopeptide repeat protein [Dyella mobilis]|uniref:Tetratricopeptide repeat protein n=1 Tax=Dyella mobilis TaxID=1849582 RepID=A0ABS2KGH5_9GAMM|nr:tetratricopeptide repeat protein [Dyella mobilis]MBM7130251.1 tetratricopeptide repeat protein [Dyella mobilis]GLQ96877.1 membrane protein [Dyella mobilis]
MSQWLHQFHFLEPEWLFGLLALPLLWWFGSLGDASRRELSRLADPELLPHLLGGSVQRARWPSGLLALGWILSVLALSGPTWSRIAEPFYANRAAQVVAISLSQHALAHDVAPSRMDRARYKARDLLAANKDGLNALIGYAGQSFVVAPLTSDAHSLDDLLDAMAPDTMPVDGNDAAQAIEQGVQLIQHAKEAGGSIVLITDDADADAQVAARKALASGVRVSVLGMGTEQGAPVTQSDGSFMHDDQGNIVVARRHDQNLRELAQAGGGAYVAMSDDGSDVAALRAQLQPAQHASLAQGQSGDAWQDRGPWLLLPLLLVVAMAFRRGWVLVLPLVLLPLLPMNAHASGWQDWWRRPDQQAASALKQGNAAEAQQLAQDPALRGAAAYRAKDFSASVQALQQAKGADAKYNLGNALARLGRYPDAIKAYDEALKLDPRNEDAIANRKAVYDAMQQSTQKSSSQQQQKSGSGQNGKSGQAGQGSQSQQSPGQQGRGSSSGQGQSGQQQDSARQNGQDQNNPQQRNDEQNGEQKKDQQPSSQSGNDSDQAKQRANRDAASQNPAPSSSTEQAKADKAQQGLQAQMNNALAQAEKPAQKPAPTHELGMTDSDDPLSKLPNDVRRNLQRVPDDPGALLRRKFELEYRERMGAQPDAGDQP